MDLISRNSRRQGLPVVLSAGFLLVLSPCIAKAQTNAPIIISQPVSGVAAAGEDFAFTVEAVGTPPLSYQWWFAGTNLAGATTSSLLLTNISGSQAGYYAAVITNTAGAVTSSLARLIVKTTFPRRLSTGRIVFGKDSQVGVPIVLRGNGLENSVSFSLGYSATQLSNPVFIPKFQTASVTTNFDQAGVVGVSITLPPDGAFPPGYTTLGLMQFDVAPGGSPFRASLAFATNPIPIAAANTAQAPLGISADVQPQILLLSEAPALDRQSGLFKQQVVIYNSGADVMTNVNIVPQALGNDALMNRITFYNSSAILTNFPYNDPLVEISSDCDCNYVWDPPPRACDFDVYLLCATSANSSLDSASATIYFTFAQINYLQPGEGRTLTLEYYVSDHATAPPVTYSVYLADPVDLSLPSNLTPLTITTNRYVNGTFLIEFPTKVGYLYYIEYARTPDFTNSFAAFPAVIGTGSQVQWIDDGPPKTISPPVNGSRFYRVYQTQ